MIPFDVHIPEHEQDKELPAKLKAEAPAILARIVRAGQRWIKDGYELAEPDKVMDATDDYRDDEDLLAEFIDERCYIPTGDTNGYKITKREMYKAYQLWATERGDKYPLGQRSFCQKIEKLEGVESKQARVERRNQQCFVGIDLRERAAKSARRRSSVAGVAEKSG